MKKIVLFNHKGGVSKTTSTYHIGWMIAEMGYKVLLVDADPQCNLTSLFLGNKFDQYYDSEDTRHENIMDGVRPAFSGAPKAIKAVKCNSAERNGNLYLLAGHMNLSEYDAQLNFAFTAAQAMLSLQSLPGAFNDLIEKTAHDIGAEYIFIDLNPGLSTINQDLFLISDAFIIPTNPDTFSLMAIKSLSLILPRWMTWKKNNITMFSNSAYPFPEGTPKFIGEIPQRFNIRNGEPTLPFKDKIEELAKITKNCLVPALKEVGMTFSDAEYKTVNISTENYELAEIKDFQGLSPKSHKVNVPVYALTDLELSTTGAALQGQKDNREEFRAIYRKIANAIITLLK
ncbi:ParA family protein [Barnesiella viscericola]|uniref:ParA family protein n=1 Tax=Barnesiella viscericola TaxID=397865 RepID=UPI0024B6A9CF|nr:ParA family protein [Barnesiella viscericola]